MLRGDGGKGTLSATEWRRFRLEKGADDGLRFDRRGVDGGDPDRVDQALFAMFHSAPRPGEVRLEMRNLRIVPARGTPAGLPEGPDPLSALGGLKNVILAPGVTRSIAPDGALSLRGNIVMHERNSAEKKCSLRLKKTVDLSGKALQFDLRTPNGKLDTLYMRFFNAGKPKASWAFYSYASPVGKEWTRFVIQRQFSPRLNWHLAWGDDSPLDELDRIDITFGNFGARLGGEIGLDLRNLQVVDELPRLGTGLRRAVSLSRTTPLVSGVRRGRPSADGGGRSPGRHDAGRRPAAVPDFLGSGRGDPGKSPGGIPVPRRAIARMKNAR